MGSAKKAFSGMLWNIVVNAITAIYGFIATPILIKYFGRSEYGIIALATSINAYMALMDMGLSSTNVRFFSNWLSKGNTVKVKKLMQTCTAFYSVIGFINSLILIAISFFSHHIFNITPEQNIALNHMLWILSLTAIINWYTSCFSQLISATENVAWIQKRTLITKLLMIVVVVLTVKFKFTIIQYFIATIFTSLVIMPATLKKAKKEINYISYIPKFDKKIFKEILPYSLNIFSFSIFQFSYNNLKTVFLGMQGSIEAVTDNGVMASIAGLVTMIGRVFIGSLLPASTRIIANKDKKNYYFVAYNGTRYITIVLCFCAFGLMSINKDLIMIYVGEDFMHLISWLNIWTFLTITSNVSCISSLILAGTNIKPLTYSSAIACILGLLSCWFSIPRFQAGGIVIAMIVYNLTQQTFYYFYYWPKILKINSKKIFFKIDIPFLLLGGGLFFILDNLPHFSNHIINIFIFGSIFSILYTAVTYLLLDKSDRFFLYKLIKTK